MRCHVCGGAREPAPWSPGWPGWTACTNCRAVMAMPTTTTSTNYPVRGSWPAYPVRPPDIRPIPTLLREEVTVAAYDSAGKDVAWRLW